MDFYNAMHKQNDSIRAVVEDEGIHTGDDEIGSFKPSSSNFINYQYCADGTESHPTSIPSEQKPSPKKLNTAISKRTESPAKRYIGMVNKKK